MAYIVNRAHEQNGLILGIMMVVWDMSKVDMMMMMMVFVWPINIEKGACCVV